MHRWAKVSTAVVAACVVAASSASAQSANINVNANVYQAIAFTGTADLEFGNVFPGVVKTILVADAASGRFNATGQANANVNLTFDLPTDLVNGGNNLPIGSWDACRDIDAAPAGCTQFTPVDGVASPATFSAAGQLFIFLGATVTPAANQAPGGYTGTVSLTLAYF
jgi:hypothetical protein